MPDPVPDPIHPLTFNQLLTAVLMVAFPNRVARSLIPVKRSDLSAALVQIQTFIPRYQLDNIEIKPADITANCGIAEIPAPEGHVYRVYGLGPPPTYPIPGESCRIQPYHPASRKAAEAYADGYRAARQCSVNSGGEFCYPFEKTWFSMWDQSIFLWPPPPKGWGVVIEWKGIKYQWGADDIVPFSGQ